MQKKIRSIGEMGDISANLRQYGQSIVQCHGVFDLLHPGHIAHFEAAKNQGDLLMVTITPDRYVNKGPGRPAFGEELRAMCIAALSVVDYVAINEWPTAVEAIHCIKPNVYAKGGDYIDANNDPTGGIRAEQEAVEAHDGLVYFTREVIFSSSKLINSLLPVYGDEVRTYLNEIKHTYNAEDIITAMGKLRDLRVLVVGETIIDEYCYCSWEGKSPKEYLIPARYLSEERFAGGAVMSANHVAGFCKEVTLATGLGINDNMSQYVLGQLKPNVKIEPFHTNAPTIIKRRFLDQAFLRKMFEVINIDESKMDHHSQLREFLVSHAGDYDLVIVNDFGHGFLTRDVLIPTLESEMKARFLCVNTQTNSSNAGFNLVTKYGHNTPHYICLDEPEIRLAARDKSGPLEDIISTIARRMHSRVMVTRGHRGAIAYDGSFHKAPALTRDMIDTMGAGDALLSVTSPCLAAGLPMDMVAFIGNAIGALAVHTVGNRSPIGRGDLFPFIKALLA